MYSEFPFKFIIQGDKKVYKNTRITVRIPESRKNYWSNGQKMITVQYQI